MFKRMLGSKKIEAKGPPVSIEEVTQLIKDFLPITEDINEYLKFEPNPKSSNGFLARWIFYTRDRDTDSFQYRNYLCEHTIKVDIDPGKHSVQMKARNFMRTKRVPKGEPIHEPWQRKIKIGKLADVQAKIVEEERNNVFVYAPKKELLPIAEAVAAKGWDALL